MPELIERLLRHSIVQSVLAPEFVEPQRPASVVDSALESAPVEHPDPPPSASSIDDVVLLLVSMRTRNHHIDGDDIQHVRLLVALIQAFTFGDLLARPATHRSDPVAEVALDVLPAGDAASLVLPGVRQADDGLPVR